MLIPTDLEPVLDSAWGLMQGAPGFLTEREGRFLALAAAVIPARGVILEIGSFKGKSTIGLASVARHYKRGPVVAVDPFTAPSSTDPYLQGAVSSYPEFEATLRHAGLFDDVEVHRTYSREVAKSWTRPIRLLWIDGDHTYAGAKADFDLFRPFLATGAVVALHDSLNLFEGPIRVAVEDLFRSDDFGPAGFCGSIAWAQFRPVDASAKRFRERRRSLARRAARLLPFVARGKALSTLQKLRYKFWRSRIPRGAVIPEHWAHTVRL